MYKVIIGIMRHVPGKTREYADTHVKTGFSTWHDANEWRVSHPLFVEDNIYFVITKDNG